MLRPSYYDMSRFVIAGSICKLSMGPERAELGTTEWKVVTSDRGRVRVRVLIGSSKGVH